MSSINILHSKKNVKWGTPVDTIERARKALGGEIHLDPSSSAEFNERVKAWRWITEQENGLTTSWPDRLASLRESPSFVFSEDRALFVNPPGGLVKKFWEKLVNYYAEGQIGKAIWIGFSVEQLCTLQDIELYPMDFSTVILRKRLNFTAEDGTSGESPSHGNYITGLGIQREIFEREFGSLGRIHHGQAALS